VGTLSERTHDYSVRYWGHDYAIHSGRDGGQWLNVSGWGRGIEPADYLILRAGPQGTTRYQVAAIEYSDNPSDMWNAELTFAPRLEPAPLMETL
jgi:hypothetical protein